MTTSETGLYVFAYRFEVESESLTAHLNASCHFYKGSYQVHRIHTSDTGSPLVKISNLLRLRRKFTRLLHQTTSLMYFSLRHTALVSHEQFSSWMSPMLRPSHLLVAFYKTQHMVEGADGQVRGLPCTWGVL